MFGEAHEPDVNEEKMSNEEWDEGEANCEDNELKFSGPMSEKGLIAAGKPEPIIPIKIETSDQFAPHIYSGDREFMSERETANSLTLENKDKKLREFDKRDLIAETKRSTKVNHCFTEFERIIGRRAIVLLERCALPSSASAPIRYFNIENESGDKNSFSVETEGEKQKKISEKAEERLLDGTGKFKQLEVTIQRETHTRKNRLAVITEKKRKMIENETPVQRQKRQAMLAEYTRRHIVKAWLEHEKRLPAGTEKKRKMIENETPVQRQKRLVMLAEYTRRHIVKAWLEHEKRLPAGTEMKRMGAIDRESFEQLEKYHLAVAESCERVRKLKPTFLNEDGLSPRDGNENNNNIKNEPIDVEVDFTFQDGNIKTSSEDANEKDLSSKDVNETNFISTQSKVDNENEGFDFSSQHINGQVIKSKVTASVVEDEENEANEIVNVLECHPTNTESVRTRKGPETPEQRKKRLGKKAECEKRKMLEQCYKNLVAYAEYWKKLIEKETRDHEKHLSAVNEKLRKQTEYEMLQQFKVRLVAETERWRNRMENERMKQYEKCLVTSEKQKHLLAMIEYNRKAIETEMSQQLEKCDLARAEISLSHQDGNETNNTRTGSYYSNIIITKKEAAPSALEQHDCPATERERKRKAMERKKLERSMRQAETYRRRRARETPEQRSKRQAYDLERSKRILESETPEQRKNRLARRAESRRKVRESETPEQRKERQAAKAEARKKAKERETPEQRHKRLSKVAEYRRRAKEKELAEQCKKRLVAYPVYWINLTEKNNQEDGYWATAAIKKYRKLMPKETVGREEHQVRCAERNMAFISPQVDNKNNNSFNVQSVVMDEGKVEYSAQDGNMIQIKSEETNEENLSSENVQESNVVIKSEVVNETEKVNYFLQQDVIGTNGIKSEDNGAFEDKNDEIEIDFEAYLHPKIEMEPYISW